MCGFCACLCFVMDYFVTFLVLQSSWRGRDSWLLAFIVLQSLVTVNVLWIFLTVPLVYLQCLIAVVFPDHTHLLFLYLAYNEKRTFFTSKQPNNRSYPYIISSCIYHVQINLNKICLNQQPKRYNFGHVEHFVMLSNIFWKIYSYGLRTNWAVFVADILLFGQERDFVMSLSLKLALLKHLPLLQDNKMTCLL